MLSLAVPLLVGLLTRLLLSVLGLETRFELLLLVAGLTLLSLAVPLLVGLATLLLSTLGFATLLLFSLLVLEELAEARAS